MSEDSKSGGTNFGCLGEVAAIAGLVATLTLGPVDFFRAVYNQIIGDMPVLKRQLVDKARDAVKERYSDLTEANVEARLARELRVPYTGQGSVNPADVSIEELFDHVEDHCAWYDRWVWARTSK